ncbi:MAG: beta-lactamase family protein, partial [Acidobacteriota bacterium]|nr:beta-lactamase family protein [Acidobacteriota bacterium]
FPDGDKITINQLLTHTSGLPRYVFLPDYQDRSQRMHTTKDLVDWIRDKERSSSPGEKYAYSNANYAILAHIIERVSGEKYGDFLSRHIFAPLGLSATGHRAEIHAPIKDMAFGYVPVGIKDLYHSPHHDYTSSTGAGSLFSTTGDIYKWFNAWQSGELLNKQTRKLITEMVGSPIGYSWHTEKRVNRDALVMTGWDGVGFAAQFLYFPDEKLTVIVLSNFNMSSITVEIADNVAAIGFGEAYRPLELRTTRISSKDELRELAGLYRFGKDFYVPDSTIRIVESGGNLLVPAEPPFPEGGLLPLKDGSYIHRQHWFRLSFRRDDSGKVTGMKYGDFEAKKET